MSWLWIPLSSRCLSHCPALESDELIPGLLSCTSRVCPVWCWGTCWNWHEQPVGKSHLNHTDVLGFCFLAVFSQFSGEIRPGCLVSAFALYNDNMWLLLVKNTTFHRALAAELPLFFWKQCGLRQGKSLPVEGSPALWGECCSSWLRCRHTYGRCLGSGWICFQRSSSTEDPTTKGEGSSPTQQI